MRQPSPIIYHRYRRGSLTFYITDTQKIYFETKLQKFVLCHSGGVFLNNYEVSNRMRAVGNDIRKGRVKDINSLAHSCLAEGVIWQSINKLPL